MNANTSMFLSGKVVLQDGTEPGEGAAIQTICRGQKHTETYSDSHGNFSFQFASRLNAASSAGLGDADTVLWSGTTSGRGSNRSLQDCELQAVLPGFTSQVIELGGFIANSENYNVGRIVMHRLGQVEGLTISATSAGAPSAARKAFEKGIDQEKKSQWDDAQQSFETAVRLYEKYAVAWVELGRLQMRKNDVNEARQSFEAAMTADPRYISSYQQLMQLAVKEHQWPAVIAFSDKMLALNAVNFPDAWFFNGAANYLLKNLEAAEKSARQGLKIDEEKHFPKLEYLLGMILIQKHEYNEAAANLRQYLHDAKTTSEADEARKELAEAERLSATASAPSAEQK